MKTATLEQRLEKLLPDWPSFNIQFHGLWREPEGVLTDFGRHCIELAASNNPTKIA